MNKREAKQLADIQAHDPRAACQVLCDTGFGDLAEDWIASQQEFETQRKQSPLEVPGTLLQAYARM